MAKNNNKKNNKRSKIITQEQYNNLQNKIDKSHVEEIKETNNTNSATNQTINVSQMFNDYNKALMENLGLALSGVFNSVRVDKDGIRFEKSNVIQNNANVKPTVGVVGVPHMGTFPWQTFISFLSLKAPSNTIIKYHLIGSSLIYDARDKIIEFAKTEKADWIMYIDSDMVIPNDALVKFTSAKLDGIDQLEMLSGMCFKRTYPFQPCFYTTARIDKDTKKPVLESPIDFPEKGLIECEGFGMACAFIRMSAIEKIEKTLKEKNQEVDYFFPFRGIGEDLSFCLRARMAGVRMFTDLSINVGHVATMVVQKEEFISAKQHHMQNNPNQPLFKEN